MKNTIAKCVLSFLFVSLDMYGSTAEQKTDFVIFSFDRPLQLYALLESIKLHVTGIGETKVIYRASNENFIKGYQEVMQEFPDAQYTMQGTAPREDFKPLTLQAIFSSPNQYIIFAVDDIIVKDTINFTQCVHMLEQTGAYGFFLRLGKNLTECYAMNHAQAVPSMLKIKPDIYGWCFSIGELDWNYPHTVDMTLYRKKDIEPFFNGLAYTAPNSLEASWAAHAKATKDKYGLCYEKSKIINIPLNLVQTDIAPNRNMNFLSPQKLLEIFLIGLKIDVKSFINVDNKAAHVNIEPLFRVRK